jgi:hypothetical protein
MSETEERNKNCEFLFLENVYWNSTKVRNIDER